MLYHFSEEPCIKQFHPRVKDAGDDGRPVVWAVDANLAPLYYFPKECPRIGFWIDEANFDEGPVSGAEPRVPRVMVMEGRWLRPLMDTVLYVYEFDDASFSSYEGEPGFYVSYGTVIPTSVRVMGNLLDRLTQSGVELRIVHRLEPPSENSGTSSNSFPTLRRLREIR